MKKIYHLVTLPVFALTLLLMVQCDSSQQPNGLDLLLGENSGVDTSKPDIDEDVQKKVSESEGEGTNEETDITIIVTPEDDETQNIEIEDDEIEDDEIEDDEIEDDEIEDDEIEDDESEDEIVTATDNVTVAPSATATDDHGADNDGDGFSDTTGDCDDANGTVYPNAIEICEGIDNDCDETVDEGCPAVALETDDDGDGFTENDDDCNDSNYYVHPHAIESCDGINNDCDGQTDEGCPPIDLEIDNDGDGFSVDDDDCNDSNYYVHPHAIERCDGIDDDCDGHIDEGKTKRYYFDNDRDGYGSTDIGESMHACTKPANYVLDHTDCDDFQAGIHPAATEMCDGVSDENCNGLVDENCPNNSLLNSNETKINIIKFYIDRLNTSIATISNTAFRNVEVRIHFFEGKDGSPIVLSGKTMADLGVENETTNDSDTFEVNLQNYADAMQNLSDYDATDFATLFQLDNINRIELINNSNDQWGIQKIGIYAAINNVFVLFYYNEGVWSYLRRNDAISSYPTTSSNNICMVQLYNGMFHTFPGTPDYLGGVAYDIPEFPVTSTLRFTPQDHWFEFTMKTLDVANAGSFERVWIRFEDENCGYTKLFIIPSRNVEKSMSFYSGMAVTEEDIRNGFRIKLSATDSSPIDPLVIQSYSVTARGAWLTKQGNVKNFEYETDTNTTGLIIEPGHTRTGIPIEDTLEGF